MTTVVSWQTLASVELSGNNVADFSSRWYNVLKEIRVRADPESLIEMQIQNMKTSFVFGKRIWRISMVYPSTTRT